MMSFPSKTNGCILEKSQLFLSKHKTLTIKIMVL